MSPWSFRAMWPVEDEDTSYSEACAFAAAEVEALAEESRVRLVGEPTFEMVEHDGDDWPHTTLVLVAHVPAVPAHPTREQYPQLIEHCAQVWGMTDRQIGELLGLGQNSVFHTRRVHKIPPGVPPGYRSRDQIAEPAGGG